MLLCYNPPAISAPPYYTMTLYDKMKNTKAPSPCVLQKHRPLVFWYLSEAKNLAFSIHKRFFISLRYIQNDTIRNFFSSLGQAPMAIVVNNPFI